MMKHKHMATWKCNVCGKSENVSNGYCKGCGPVQTTPIDKDAKKEAKIKVVEPKEEELLNE